MSVTQALHDYSLKRFKSTRTLKQLLMNCINYSNYKFATLVNNSHWFHVKRVFLIKILKENIKA